MATQRVETLVELDGVTKRFGDVTAVNAIDLSVRQGEFFILVGPSGSGKTTTLRMISGFERPSDGEVVIDGRPMSSVPPEARDTNLVFQRLSLFPHMSVGENVGYGLKKSGVDRDELRQRQRLRRRHRRRGRRGGVSRRPGALLFVPSPKPGRNSIPPRRSRVRFVPGREFDRPR